MSPLPEPETHIDPHHYATEPDVLPAYGLVFLIGFLLSMAIATVLLLVAHAALRVHEAGSRLVHHLFSNTDATANETIYETNSGMERL